MIAEGTQQGVFPLGGSYGFSGRDWNFSTLDVELSAEQSTAEFGGWRSVGFEPAAGESCRCRLCSLRVDWARAKEERAMLAAVLLMGEVAATGMIQMGPRAILTYTVQQSEDAHWSGAPSARDIAATKAARIPGGSRAALKCTADKQGQVTNCEVVTAEPDRPEVGAAALKMATLYKLDADGTQKIKWSKNAPVIWLQIMFPDSGGVTPNDCHPAFGCIIEHMPPPPPPPPSASRVR